LIANTITILTRTYHRIRRLFPMPMLVQYSTHGNKIPGSYNAKNPSSRRCTAGQCRNPLSV